MAKPSIPLSQIRDDFIKCIDNNRLIIKETLQLKENELLFQNFGQGRYKKVDSYCNQLIGNSFASIIASWEEFLEECMIRYLRGRVPTTSLIRHTKSKLGHIPNVETAYKVLGGSDFIIGKHYLGYSSLETVRRDADAFLENHPFVFDNNDIEMMRRAIKIRNRVAHTSHKCRQDFLKVVKIYLQIPPNNSLPNNQKGWNVGKLLLQQPNQYLFSNIQLNTLPETAVTNDHIGFNNFEMFCENIIRLARVIAP